ncbi:hypothetical protein B0H17DRAFT_1206233 [Mycena rosella]|uniref:Uncharacterized protein n=1 Tax=Mycena rosella TaxID=1033263 RepID=A0AAD7G975_MYCRO|nr:hypothetical protein B0H17DRAFT_1206233 [Mycena rosella]
MLILDVKLVGPQLIKCFVWRALDYRKIINDFVFVGKHRDLRHLDLTDIIGMRSHCNYYHKSGESPYYMWAALLDPRISYEGLKHDFCHDDDDLLNDLEDAKTKLDEYFRRNYTDTVSSTPVQSTSSPRVQSTSRIQSSLQKGFTQRYHMQPSITAQP